MSSLLGSEPASENLERYKSVETAEKMDEGEMEVTAQVQSAEGAVDAAVAGEEELTGQAPVPNGHAYEPPPVGGSCEAASAGDAAVGSAAATATSGQVTAAEEIGTGEVTATAEITGVATATGNDPQGGTTENAPAVAAGATETAPVPMPAAAKTARSSRKRGWDQLDDPNDPAAKRTSKSVSELTPAQVDHIERAKKFCAEQTAAFKASQMARHQHPLLMTPQMPGTMTPQMQLQNTLQKLQANAQQSLQNQQAAQIQQMQQQVAVQFQAQQLQAHQHVAQIQAQAAQAKQQAMAAAVAGATAAAAGAGIGGLAQPAALRGLQMQEQSQRQRALQLMCRVYVGSINFDMKEDQVKQAFLPFGPIRSIDLAWDAVAMKHKGFAFVEYECPEAAQIALDQMNGVMLGGRNIKCGRPSSIPAAAPVIAQMQTEAESYARIYVASIHPDLNESDVKSVFEAFGKITSIELATETVPGKHRGYAFIEYETKQAAMDAIASMNLFDLGGQYLRVGKCVTPPMPAGAANAPQPGPSGPVIGPAAAAAAANVPGAAQAQLAVSAIQSRLAGLDNSATSVAPTSSAPPGLGSLAGLSGLGGLAGLAGVPGLAGLAHFGQLGQIANAANLLRAANLPGLASGLAVSLANAQQAAQQSQMANVQAAAATLTTSSASAAISSVDAAAAAGAAAAAKIPKNEQSLSTEESISISGTNARFMLMQKLQRTNESTVVVLRDMVSVEDLDEELESEVTEECSRHGKVKRVVIYQERQGEEDDAEVIVKIFVRFFERESADAAIKALDNRWFGGRVIKAEVYDEDRFEANDLSG